MAVNRKARPLDINAILSGAAHIEAVRGITNWGANWVYNSGGLQGDILAIADTFNSFSTSGAYATDAELAILSGYYASGYIGQTSANALPSGGFYIHAGDDATGIYKVYVNSAGSSSGNLMIIPV